MAHAGWEVLAGETESERVTSGAVRVYPGGVLHVDNSMAATVAECRRKAVLKYHLGYVGNEPNAPIEAGRWAHEVLAAWARGESKPIERLRPYAAWAAANVRPDEPRLSYDNVERVMRLWLQAHPRDGVPWEFIEEAVEVRLEVAVEEGLVLTGQCDAIVRMGGRLYVLEHKTTGTLTGFWKQKWPTSSQLSGYVWGAGQLTGETVVGAIVNAIEMGKVPSAKTRKCPEHGVMYSECGEMHTKAEYIIVPRTEEQLRVWKQTLVEQGERFREAIGGVRDIGELREKGGLADGMFNGACTGCEFREFCGAGMQEHMREVMLDYRPWPVVWREEEETLS
jgi:hypothetical protein